MRCSGLAAVLCALFLSSRAEAAGALDLVALQATQSLGHTPASSVVVASPLASDEPAPKGSDLALRVAALIAGRIGAGVRIHAQTARLASARTIAGRAGALVYVQ